MQAFPAIQLKLFQIYKVKFFGFTQYSEVYSITLVLIELSLVNWDYSLLSTIHICHIILNKNIFTQFFLTIFCRFVLQSGIQLKIFLNIKLIIAT